MISGVRMISRIRPNSVRGRGIQREVSFQPPSIDLFPAPSHDRVLSAENRLAGIGFKLTAQPGNRHIDTAAFHLAFEKL